MKTKRADSGFTLAEMLIVVAIVLILMAVSFIAVQNQQRAMTRLEFDTIAKEIFIAAQNHLTTAESQGYLQASLTAQNLGTETDTNGEYFLVANGADSFSSNPVLELMLPFGAVDETVRLGGSYIIHYQPSSARVLDVFYSFPGKSSFLTIAGTKLGDGDFGYTSLMANCAGDGNKSARQNYHKAVVGWYGGEEGLLSGERLKVPTIEIINKEQLLVKVTGNNSGGSLKLIITGEISGAQKAFSLNASEADQRVVLDDITQEGPHFAELDADNYESDGITKKKYIPGENVIVEAVAFDNSRLTNIAYSGKKTTNSLFADIDDTDSDKKPDSASVAYFRHLENLDAHISRLDDNDTGNMLNITKAKQIADLNWDSFKNEFGTSVQIKPLDGSPSGEGTYLPVNPTFYNGNNYETYALIYDGQNHKVSNLEVNCAGDAGLFGTLPDGSTVSNLELIDFSITSTGGNAGALAGTVGTTPDGPITNVLAYNSAARETAKAAATDKNDITSGTSGSAGGLIGSMTGGSIKNSAAALIVNGGADAGGLIGTSSGGTVTACYSGGHTVNGKYTGTTSEGVFQNYNVTAQTGTAGGLIGAAENTGISNSYSTCSAAGTTAGGFVGTSTGSIENCYCTGLVKGTTTEGAFAGSSGFTLSDCRYFEIINERAVKEGEKIKEFEFLTPLPKTGNGDGTSAGITALDKDADTYDEFCGSDWKAAIPYDSTLKTWYQEKYNLKTVQQLAGATSTVKDTDFVARHYGDWPAPEIFVVNAS